MSPRRMITRQRAGQGGGSRQKARGRGDHRGLSGVWATALRFGQAGDSGAAGARQGGPGGGFQRELGPIDVWINDAMVSVFSPFKEMDGGVVRRTTEVTYLGQVYGTMAALKRMLPARSGT